MTIEILQTEMVKALKEGKMTRKVALSNYIAQIKKSAIDKNCRDNITEAFVDAELVKIMKSVQEQIDTCPITRRDLMEKYQEEKAIIREFAPVLITDPERIVQIIFENYTGPRTQKDIMKWLTTNYRGKIDMKSGAMAAKVFVE